MTRKPDLFVIGAAKCGTTSLYEWLKGHPEIFMSPAKEPRYFAPDLDSGAGHDLVYGRDAERYMALFDGARDEKRLGEASVRYIYSHEAPRLVHEFNPDAYIVAMVRDPVAMIYSMHNQLVSEGAEPLTDFAAALEAEPERLAGKHVPGKVVPALTVYRPRARFAEQLQRWFDLFGRERVHVIVMEDIVRDPPPHFRRLLEFLDVDPDWQPEAFAAYNTSHAPRSRFLRTFTKSRLPQWFVWEVLPRVVGDRATRRMVRAFRHSAVNRKPNPRTPLPQDLRDRLRDEFEPEVERLGALLGRDLAALWWPDRAGGGAAGASRPAETAGQTA